MLVCFFLFLLFSQDHIQKCSLAGGVAIGVSMSVVHRPWVAMTIGLAAGVISTLSLRYLKVSTLN